jgi:hypothetical protein
MNRVSNITLAIAIQKARAFPSLSSDLYYSNQQLDFELLKKDLLYFKDSTGSTNLLIGLQWNIILKPDIVEFLNKEDFKFVELYNTQMNGITWDSFSPYIEDLKNRYDMKIIFKTLGSIPKKHCGTIILKGSEGAGRSIDDNKTLKEKFNDIRIQDQSLRLIPSGGISTYDQITYYMSMGAFAIGIGTLFAMSEESPISYDTKKKIIDSTSNDLSKNGKFNTQGILITKIENDDDNCTQSLIHGMKSPNSGILFAGKGIDNINKIKPVKDIIEELVQNDYQ